MSCPTGIISSIDFASFGTPTGSCGSFAKSSCNSPKTLILVSEMCINKTSCIIPVSTAFFGDPCPSFPYKYLSVQVSCSPVPNNLTSWDFSLIDPLVEDFFHYTNGTKHHLFNFESIPAWLFVTNTTVPYPKDPKAFDMNYSQGSQLRDPTLKEITDYFVNFVGWYSFGGFYDEYGKHYKSNYYYDLPIWEVLNEVDLEHGLYADFYTSIYDSIVTGIRDLYSRNGKSPNTIKFMGPALSGFRPGEEEFIAYFLNHSNHRPNIPIDYLSYHYYAVPSSRTNTSAYHEVFDQADQFVKRVLEISNIKSTLSPLTQTDIDEVGVMLPNDSDPNPAPIPSIYWNAAGGLYAYLFSQLGKHGIQVLGCSQLVANPGNLPSIAMVNYTNGEPNARFYILKMLIDNLYPDELNEIRGVETRNDSPNLLHVQGYLHYDKRRGSVVKKILVVNKSLETLQVNILGIQGSKWEVVFNTRPETFILQEDHVICSPFAVGLILMK